MLDATSVDAEAVRAWRAEEEARHGAESAQAATAAVRGLGDALRRHVLAVTANILAVSVEATDGGLEIFVGRTAVPRLAATPWRADDISTWSFATSVSGPAARWNTTYKRQWHGLVVALVVPPDLGGLALGRDSSALAAHELSLLLEQQLIRSLEEDPPHDGRVTKCEGNRADRGNQRGKEGAHVAAHCVYFAYRLRGVPVPEAVAPKVPAQAIAFLSPLSDGSGTSPPPSA